MRKQQDHINQFKCTVCDAVVKQFTLLDCNHVVCINCVNQIKNKDNVIRCICDAETKIPFESASTNTFETTTSHSNKLKYYLSNDPVLPFELEENRKKKDQSRRIKTEVQQEQPSDGNSLAKDLTTQLDFLQIQFQKSIEELRAVFEKQVSKANKIYSEFKQSIRIWYLELIPNQNILARINLPKLIKDKYLIVGDWMDKLRNLLFEYDNNKSPRLSCFYIKKPSMCNSNTNLNSLSYVSPIRESLRPKGSISTTLNAVESLILQRQQFANKKRGINSKFK